MEIEQLLALTGAAGLWLPALVRMIALWKSSRRSTEATIEVKGVKVRLDLSNPKEAEEYLEVLQKRLNAAREG
ncbi:hypothetical protein ACFY12_21540 [Streptomyces sp. NPDC001339]|uniref:effector-associated constant component EACC1 n=1 Tax=Streptomyces sp. NPDC001339 TaxID=3364563 RepID=UPI0036CB5FD6